jgi:glutaredoxin 2
VRAYGFARLPDITRARREVKHLTGESYVPVLLLEDGTAIAGSNNIVAWAGSNSRRAGH